jgi:hypothetical protein
MNFQDLTAKSFLKIKDQNWVSLFRIYFKAISFEISMFDFIVSQNGLTINKCKFFKVNSKLPMFSTLATGEKNKIIIVNTVLQQNTFDALFEIYQTILNIQSSKIVFYSTLSSSPGFLLMAKDSVIKFASLTLSGANSLELASAIYIRKGTLNIEKSLFINNNNPQGFGGIFTADGSKIEQLSNNIFLRNRAVYGGAFTLIEPAFRTIIKDNIFRSNKGKGRSFEEKSIRAFEAALDRGLALKERIRSIINIKRDDNGKGGCFYIQSLNKSDDLSLTGNKFKDNEASAGGILFHETFYKQPGLLNLANFNCKNHISTGNKAEFYGNLIATNVFDIIVSENPPFRDVYTRFHPIGVRKTLSNMVLGRKYDNCLLYIWGVDAYGELAIKNSEFNLVQSFYKLSEDPSDQRFLEFQMNLGFPCIKGVESNSSKFATEERVFNISRLFITETFIDIPQDPSQPKRQPIPLQLTLRTRDCVKGEILSLNNRCLKCSKGFYSEVENFDQISQCTRCGDSVEFFCYGANR